MSERKVMNLEQKLKVMEWVRTKCKQITVTENKWTTPIIVRMCSADVNFEVGETTIKAVLKAYRVTPYSYQKISQPRREFTNITNQSQIARLNADVDYLYEQLGLERPSTALPLAQPTLGGDDS